MCGVAARCDNSKRKIHHCIEITFLFEFFVVVVVVFVVVVVVVVVVVDDK